MKLPGREPLQEVEVLTQNQSGPSAPSLVERPETSYASLERSPSLGCWQRSALQEGMGQSGFTPGSQPPGRPLPRAPPTISVALFDFPGHPVHSLGAHLSRKIPVKRSWAPTLEKES